MTVGGPAAPTTEDPLLNRVLSERYRILQKLGEGGMGVVYLAEHIVIEKKIALKVLFPDLTRRADLVQRFMQEAKSASRIGHENVIDITDFGQSPEGYVFIAMEYLVGQDLGQVLKAAGPMPWQRAQPIVLQIVKALRAAHERGIVHRDMKPENIFILPRDDGREFVKVLDFGIAKVLGLDEDAPRLTRTGMIFGTPEYMSPEQAQGQQVDHRVDIYAVGCILYHMLTGEVPFKAESFMGILSKHMLEAPVPPSTRNPAIEPAVEAIINRAMEKDPALRFQTMREFVDALVPFGHVHDPSGVISLSTGMPVHRTGMPSRAAVSAVPVSRPPGASAAPVPVVDGGTAPLPHSTHEIEGRGTTPLAQSNPEVRRSQTAFLSRESGPTPRARSSSNLILVVVGVGAVVLAGILVMILKGGATPATVSAGVGAIPTAPAAAPAPATAPAPAAAAHAPVAPAPVAVPPPAASAAVPAAPAAATSARKGKERESARGHRSSRQAVDSLLHPAGGEPTRTPPTQRTPAELKNPFANPSGP